MTWRSRRSLARLGIAMLMIAASGPQTAVGQQPELMKVTWQEYIAEFVPSMGGGGFGLMQPYALMQKYGEKRVEWSGVFEDIGGPEGKQAVTVVMPPVPFTLYSPAPRTDVVLELAAGSIAAGSASRWAGFKKGDKVTFRAVLGGFTMLVDTEALKLEGFHGRKGRIPIAVLSDVEPVDGRR